MPAIPNYYKHRSKRKPVRIFVVIWIIGLLGVSTALILNPGSQILILVLVAYSLVGVPILLNLIAR